MKTKTINRSICAVAATVLLASAPVTKAQNVLLDFSTNSIWAQTNQTELATWQWWGGCSTVREFSTNDAAGDPTSGSIKISVTWPTPAGAGDFQYSVGLPLSGVGNYDLGITLSALGYTNMEIDILWDTNSTANVNDHQGIDATTGNPGGDPNGFGLGFVATQYGQTWVPNANQPVLNSNGVWQHFVIPIDNGWPAIPGLIFKKWRSNGDAGAANLAGTTSTFYVDNIKFNYNTNQVIPLPVAKFEKAAPGLNITAAQAAAQYQRESVRSIPGDSIAWVGNPDPVTYSWTINSFPSRTDAPGYFGTLFLAPNGAGGETPDWDDANVIVIETSLNAGLQGTCTFRFKTNAPNNNGVLYGVGGLGTLNDPSGVLGTWTATFTNNSYCTLVGPSGVSLTVDMGADAAAFFAVNTGSLPTYFGFQPGGPANIGYRASYSRLKIQNGATTVVDDTFTSLPDLDPNLWIPAFQAPDANAYKVVTHGGAYWYSWNKPDGFFQSISASANLSTGWQDTGLLPVDFGSRSGAFVDTNILVNYPDSFFIRLYGTNTP